MVYIDSDGCVSQNRPWGPGFIIDVFWGSINFISLFFRSLVGLGPVSIQSRPSHSGGGGGYGGPGDPRDGPRPPRRIGRITPTTTISGCPGGTCSM